MAQLSFTLFGPLQAHFDDAPLTALRTPRLQSLLAYLVLETGHPHSREQLASLFWPDEAEPVARQNLRQALYQLRQLLDKTSPDAPPYLLLTREQVQFNSAANYGTDVAAFEHHLQQGELQAAMALYRGDLLDGLHTESDRFEEWLLVRREDLHIRAMAALIDLSETALQQNQFAQAADFARRQLALEPWLELAHRQLMSALAHLGDRSGALAQYERCVQQLQTELGITPDALTTALAEQIRQNDKMTGWPGDTMTVIPSPLHPVTPAPLPTLIDWGEAPEVTQIHGRDDELRNLARWLVTERCRMVAVLGMGGMGKTTLAACGARQIAAHFEVVIWRSLLNAPPLEEMVRAWLRLLGEQPPADLDMALTRLFDHLQTRRCLLILDNVESILQSDERAGHYRPGYATYGQLFKRFGETSHQSVLLLTGREAPQEIVRLERERPTVQMLALSGLSAEAGQTMLRQQGVTPINGAVSQLVARYSGNPLALLLVGDTIQELFDGDVTAFLEQPLIFDDIRDVLDQQWARLSTLERAVLLWLAIEREPRTLAQLSADLYPPAPMPTLIEALNSLRRRSLIEKQGAKQRAGSTLNGHGFLLQNVVTEYLTASFIAVIRDEIAAGAPQLFYRHALLKAQTKAYVRQSQRRLILQPIAEQVRTDLGEPRLAIQLQRLLTHLREDIHATHYGAGNLCNLLVQLGIDAATYDFSGLVIRQADLMGMTVQGVNFRGCHFESCRFTDTFGAITALTFSPDGQQLAAGTSIGNIRLWRVSDGQPLGVWQAHTNYVFSVLFSPDGASLYSCSDDQLICCWMLDPATASDKASPALRYAVNGHDRGVWRLALSHDGCLLASAGGDGIIVLWAAATGTEVFRFHEHTGGARAPWPSTPQGNMSRLVVKMG